MDEDVVRRVVGTVPGQLDALASDFEGPTVLEGLVWWGPCRVVIAEEELSRLLMADADDVPIEQRGRAGVVCVVVRVDEMGHPVAHSVDRGDLVHGPLDVVTKGGRRVEQDDPVACGQERGLVGRVRDPVEVPLDLPDVVALLVDGRTERRSGNRWTVRVLAWSFAVQGCRASLSRRALESLKSVVGARPGSARLAPSVDGRRKARQTGTADSGSANALDGVRRAAVPSTTFGRSCGSVGPRLWGRVLRAEPARKRLEGTGEHRP
jgi:hypothetical protein